MHCLINLINVLLLLLLLRPKISKIVKNTTQFKANLRNLKTPLNMFFLATTLLVTIGSIIRNYAFFCPSL